MFLSADKGQRLGPRWVLVTLSAQDKLPREQALAPERRHFGSEGGLPGAPRELPTGTQQDRHSGHTLQGTHSQWGASHPRCPGLTGGGWQRAASQPDRKQDDSTGLVEIPTGPHARA